MSLETASTIAGLVPANPADGDPFGQGAAHIRLVKAVLQSDAVSLSATTLQSLAGSLAIAQALTVSGAVLHSGITTINAALGVNAPASFTNTVGFAGQITVSGGSNFTTPVSAVGYNCREGLFGSYTGNAFNIYWSGSVATLFIDGSSIGSFAFTSDARIKANVQGLQHGALEAVQRLYPVSYTVADSGPFKACSTPRAGFVADAVKLVLPAAVHAAPVADTDKAPQYLSLDPMALIALLTKAVQELASEVTTLKAKLA